MKAGWEIKKLGDVCQIRTGRKDVNEGNLNGEFPFFTCAAKHTFSDTYSFDTEALLVAGNGDAGRVTYYNGKFEAYQRTYVLTGFVNISSHFLYLILDGKLKDTISSKKLGATMPYIKVGMLKDFEIPVPPLPEQRRIVAILDEAFAGIAAAKEKAEQNLKNAKEVFEAHLQGIFATPKHDWQTKKVGDICKSIEYGTSSKSQKSGKVPVLRMGNIQDGKLDWSDLVYSDNLDEIEKYSLRNGDVLFNRTNSAEHVGKTAIFRGEQKAIFAGYLIRINVKKNIIDPEFLTIYLNSRKIREYGFSVMTSSVNQANISGSKLKEYPFLMPPLSEQHQIVAQLDSLSAETSSLESLYQQKLSNLEELKKSLLQQAFSGAL